MYGDSAVDDGYEVQLGDDCTSTSSNTPVYCTVEPGDAMSASVSVVDDAWTLALADSTQGWTYATPQIDFSAAQTSAEWIGERPEVGSELASLADFGSLSFTGATATANGVTSPISAFSGYAPMEMENTSGDTLAAPGLLDPTGDGFTDTWYASK
jgi:hypothetical protein